MIYFRIFSICSALLLTLFSCESARSYNKGVRQFFEVLEGTWAVEEIVYKDKGVTLTFSSDKPELIFDACPKVTEAEGGCQVTYLDEHKELTYLLAVGTFVDEKNGIGSLSLDYDFANPFYPIYNPDFNDSILVVGDVVVQLLGNSTAWIEGGRITNWGEGGTLHAGDVSMRISRK